jgi:GNAT superfamily N-acetyltransferase
MTGSRPDLEITPLTSATWEPLGTLFAGAGDARWCWCAFWHRRGSGGGRSEAEQNRALLWERTQRGDRAPGLVALRDGQAVGWVSLGPRASFPRLVHSRVLAPVDDQPVWSIVCFVVARAERGRGVGAALLDAAVGYAGEQGASMLEAYPVETGGERVPASSANTGTVSMFERAGFRVVAIRRATPTSRARPVLRRALS